MLIQFPWSFFKIHKFWKLNMHNMHKSKARSCVPTPLIHTLHVIQLKSQNENYSVETFVTNKPHWTCFTSHTNYFRNQNNSNDYIFFWLTPGVNVSTSHCTKLDKCFIYSFSFKRIVDFFKENSGMRTNEPNQYLKYKIQWGAGFFKSRLR